MKSLPEAKSRLLAGDSARHALLVRAMRADTVAAVRGARCVARMLVITDRATSEWDPVLVQTSVGLNPALVDGARHAHAAWPDDGIAALVGDLPALTSAELDAALRAAVAYPRSFVADAAGTGTTLLAVAPGSDLRPAFGYRSAARHSADAFALPAGAGLRRDVDTMDDLDTTEAIGVGAHTRAVLASLRARPA